MEKEHVDDDSVSSSSGNVNERDNVSTVSAHHDSAKAVIHHFLSKLCLHSEVAHVVRHLATNASLAQSFKCLLRDGAVSEKVVIILKNPKFFSKVVETLKDEEAKHYLNELCESSAFTDAVCGILENPSIIKLMDALKNNVKMSKITVPIVSRILALLNALLTKSDDKHLHSFCKSSEFVELTAKIFESPALLLIFHSYLSLVDCTKDVAILTNDFVEIFSIIKNSSTESLESVFGNRAFLEITFVSFEKYNHMFDLEDFAEIKQVCGVVSRFLQSEAFVKLMEANLEKDSSLPTTSEAVTHFDENMELFVSIVESFKTPKTAEAAVFCLAYDDLRSAISLILEDEQLVVAAVPSARKPRVMKVMKVISESRILHEMSSALLESDSLMKILAQFAKNPEYSKPMKFLQQNDVSRNAMVVLLRNREFLKKTVVLLSLKEITEAAVKVLQTPGNSKLVSKLWQDQLFVDTMISSLEDPKLIAQVSRILRNPQFIDMIRSVLENPRGRKYITLLLNNKQYLSTIKSLSDDLLFEKVIQLFLKIVNRCKLIT